MGLLIWESWCSCLPWWVKGGVFPWQVWNSMENHSATSSNHRRCTGRMTYDDQIILDWCFSIPAGNLTYGKWMNRGNWWQLNHLVRWFTSKKRWFAFANCYNQTVSQRQARLPLAPALARDMDATLEDMQRQAWSECKAKAQWCSRATPVASYVVNHGQAIPLGHARTSWYINVCLFWIWVWVRFRGNFR